jgi:hypothetical protein
MMRSAALRTITASALVVLTSAAPTVAAPTGARPATPKAKRRAPTQLSSIQLKQSFAQFCDEWIHKLRERERYNLAHIQWTPTADGIVGTYVGYSEEHTCILTDRKVGKIRYQQMVYEKKGSTRPTAEDSPPRAIEQLDTSEFFSLFKGKWYY